MSTKNMSAIYETDPLLGKQTGKKEVSAKWCKFFALSLQLSSLGS